MVTVVLVVVWIGSGRWFARWYGKDQAVLDVGNGSLGVGVWSLHEFPGTSVIRQGPWRWNWMPYCRADTATWYVCIPLWIPVIACGAMTAAAWRLDALARRRARLHLCPKCNYDRAGLAAGAVCPECGAGVVE